MAIFNYIAKDSSGNEPWVSDSTEAGTKMLKFIYVDSKAGGFTPAGDAGSIVTMRIKLDENLPMQLATTLSRLGHDVDSVLAEGLTGRPD